MPVALPLRLRRALRERAVIARHGVGVFGRRAVVAAGVQTVAAFAGGQALREGGFRLLQRRRHILAERVPLRVVLLERLGAGRVAREARFRVHGRPAAGRAVAAALSAAGAWLLIALQAVQQVLRLAQLT